MEQPTLTLKLISMLLFLAVAGVGFISLAEANPYMYHEFVSPPPGSAPLTISISSPKNNTIYRMNNITLTFDINTQSTSIDYLLGAYFKADWMQDNVTVYKQNTHSPEFPTFWNHSATFWQMPDGEYSIVITAWGGGFYAEGLTAYNFDMTTVSEINFIIDATPPKVSILSLENKTYDLPDVPLNFTVSERASLIRYSLDGQNNSTLNGNTTLIGLPIGGHSLTVYAWDVAGSIGASETIYFTVAKETESSEPFPTAIVAATLGASAILVGVSIFICLRRKRVKQV